MTGAWGTTMGFSHMTPSHWLCSILYAPSKWAYPISIVVIEGSAMWQIPKNPVSISGAAFALPLFWLLATRRLHSGLSSVQLSSARVSLAQLSFPLNLFFRLVKAMASFGFALSASLSSSTASLPLTRELPMSRVQIFTWQFNCMKRKKMYMAKVFGIQLFVVFVFYFGSILSSFLPSFLASFHPCFLAGSVVVA